VTEVIRTYSRAGRLDLAPFPGLAELLEGCHERLVEIEAVRRAEIEKARGAARDRLKAEVATEIERCQGHDPKGSYRCCDRAGEYNGFGSDGPLEFTCPKHCSCHD
jgi:hypothetical protein